MGNDIATKLASHIRTQKDRKLNLSQYSHARLGLGHTGGHLKCQDWLHFQSGFAQAKDALQSAYPLAELTMLCEELNLPWVEIESRANELMPFLLHPEWGAMLADSSHAKLQMAAQKQYQRKDLLIIISGGLSPLAIQHQIPTFLPAFIAAVKQKNWSIAPIILNQRGRVALGDQVNTFFNANLVIMLIGERPGISTPDSMGIYFTWQARPGCTNDQRNCISNIHVNGLTIADAISKTIYMLNEANIRKISGVLLKDISIDKLA